VLSRPGGQFLRRGGHRLSDAQRRAGVRALRRAGAAVLPRRSLPRRWLLPGRERRARDPMCGGGRSLLQRRRHLQQRAVRALWRPGAALLQLLSLLRQRMPRGHVPVAPAVLHRPRLTEPGDATDARQPGRDVSDFRGNRGTRNVTPSAGEDRASTALPLPCCGQR
jgi:hypothetical protein